MVEVNPDQMESSLRYLSDPAACLSSAKSDQSTVDDYPILWTNTTQAMTPNPNPHSLERICCFILGTILCCVK